MKREMMRRAKSCERSHVVAATHAAARRATLLQERRTISSALFSAPRSRRRGLGARVATRNPRRRHMDKRGKDGILTHTDPKHDMPEDADTPTDA